MLRKILRRMLAMCPDAWYIFIRALQLVSLLLLCAFALLVECNGAVGENYQLYMTALSLTEISQSLLLISVLASVCLEDVQTKRG